MARENKVRVLIYGAGGHGVVVAEVLRCSGACDLVGAIDDDPSLWGTTISQLNVLGGKDWIFESCRDRSFQIALGIGDNGVRREVAQRCVAAGFKLFKAVHPSAMIARTASLGDGVTVMPGVVVNPNAVIGEGTILNSAAVVEHDNKIGSFAHIAPRAATGGNVTIGELAHVGLGAVILEGRTVGAYTLVAAGAVVNKDILPGVLAMGVPARYKGVSPLAKYDPANSVCTANLIG